MRAVVLYLALAVLAALAGYIIRTNSRWISDVLFIVSIAFLLILGISILIEK
jgi:hypothetical protein